MSNKVKSNMAKNFNAFFISNNQSDSSKTSSILFIHFFMIQKLEFFSVFDSSLSPLPEYRPYDYVSNLPFYSCFAGGDACGFGYLLLYFVDSQ